MTLKSIAKSLTPPLLWNLLRSAWYQANPPVEPPRVPREGIQEIERLGLRWRLDMSSYIARQLVEHGVWEKDTTTLVEDLVRPGMQVLAVGANFGYYAILMARKVGPAGHVWAFEPTHTFREQLRWHVDANGFGDRVTIVPFGLSDSEQTRVIDLTPQSASMHYAPDVARVGTETITLRPLDQVADELGIGKVGFVSMDIDGHEPAFIKGARKLLGRDRPPIALELAQRCLHFAGSDVREVAALLRDLGYQLCDERTRQPYKTELEFLRACANFNCDVNAIALPVEGSPEN
jgi:FkbM family methyltransferase